MMELRALAADEIITLNDYPLYDDDAFRAYARMIRRGQQVPYVPVIPLEFVAFDGPLRDPFEAFSRSHPQAAYVLVDGSHRTTALCRSGLPIPAVIYRTDADIHEARAAVSSGLIRENGSLDLTFEENLAELIAHFSEKPYFMTVAQKTERLVREGCIPSAS